MNTATSKGRDRKFKQGNRYPEEEGIIGWGNSLKEQQNLEYML